MKTTVETTSAGAARAQFIQERLPAGGLFAGHRWKMAVEPFAISRALAKEIDFLGRVLLQFNRAANLLYRLSVEGKQPAWVAEWLDRGKPARLIELGRDPRQKNALPRVIRPDILLTADGMAITELDSVPGGIGLTGWLNETYSELGEPVIGGADGMIRGFDGQFGDSRTVHVMFSEESATYRPEMEWLCQRIAGRPAAARSADFSGWSEGDAVYRFFELFDLGNVPASDALFKDALEGKIRLTAPPKAYLEEKMLLALLWNRNLEGFWHRELGGRFFESLKSWVPYGWVLDTAPLPPHGAIPELNLTSWQQLKSLSQKQRELILKVSGFSEIAWGSRGVHLGSDLSAADWSAAVDAAIARAGTSPYVLQRFRHPSIHEARWWDPNTGSIQTMAGRVRLCPYYFVSGEGDALRANLGGILATICPPDKKIIHGMTDAILAPCRVAAG